MSIAWLQNMGMAASVRDLDIRATASVAASGHTDRHEITAGATLAVSSATVTEVSSCAIFGRGRVIAKAKPSPGRLVTFTLEEEWPVEIGLVRLGSEYAKIRRLNRAGVPPFVVQVQLPGDGSPEQANWDAEKVRQVVRSAGKLTSTLVSASEVRTVNVEAVGITGPLVFP